MRFVKLEKWEIYDGIHDYGWEVEIYYLQGKGIINSNLEFVQDREEISKIEEFLQNPIDKKYKLKKKWQAKR